MKVKLSDAFDLQMGKTPPRNDRECWGDGHKWISISDIGNAGKYIDTTKEEITDIGVSKSGIKVVPKGTVIMSFKLSIGKTAITTEDMYTNEAIMAFINKGKYEINTDYLYHMCKGIDWFEGTNKAVLGLTLNKATMSEKEIEIPPQEEQLQVVAVLDKMDELIALRKEQIAKLDQLVKSRFIELFGDPVSNPHGYPKVTLSELAEIKIGPFGSLLHKEDYIANGHALVNPSHIVDGKISVDNELTVSDEKFSELSAYHLQVGDLVMGRRGEMGRCAVVHTDGLLCGTGSLLIRTKGDVTADYLQKIISFPSFKKTIEDMAVGQTMPNLNVPIVSGFQIIKPPIEIQKAYYTFVEQTDKSKLAIQASLAELEILKKALMQKYFG